MVLPGRHRVQDSHDQREPVGRLLVAQTFQHLAALVGGEPVNSPANPCSSSPHLTK
jgi:hypothetical protein